jgi:hypothetical protein
MELHLPTRRRSTAGPIFAPVTEIIDITGDDTPDRLFPQYVDASQVLSN